jgi:DnaJ-class molecular chaperone
MKNYYKILGINQNASTELISKHTKKRIKEIKNSSLSYDKKKNELNKLQKSYKVLSDYHKRRELDDYLNYKNIFNNDFFSNPFEKMDLIINNDISIPNNKYYYHTSFTSSKIHENGNRIIDNKYMTNNNGKVDSKHTITEKDKKCNDIIKNVLI